MPLRILIADDSALARQTIAEALAASPDLTIIGEAADGQEALALARALHPDLILMDLNMPRVDGLLATRLIRRTLPQTAVVILTVSDDAADLFEALRSGAQGYLLKGMDPAEWLSYLRTFVHGDASIPRDFAQRLLGGFVRTEPDGEVREYRVQLTDREVQVLELVGRAMTNPEIADTLQISVQTVKNHLKNIQANLHLKNRVDLAIYARRLTPAEK